MHDEVPVDVHAPHRPIQTLKEFLLHLLTITIGLFIALMLESVVEAVHHRHLVEDARARLAQEIEGNRRLYSVNLRLVQENRARLAADIEQLRSLRAGEKGDSQALSWSWGWNVFADTSWTGARDSGALSYMDPGALAAYSAVYTQQKYVNEIAVAIIEDESKVRAPLDVAGDPSRMTPPEIETMLIDTARMYERLGLLQQLMKGLEQVYSKPIGDR